MILRTLLLLVFFFSITTGCSNLVSKLFEAPKIEDPKLSVSSMSFSDVGLNLDMTIQNPNGIDLPLEKLQAEVKVMDRPVLQKQWDELPTLKAREKTSVRLPFTLKWDQLSDLGINLFKTSKVPYQLKGTVRVRGLDLPFDEKGEWEMNRK